MDANTLDTYVRTALQAQGFAFDEARIKEIILQYARIEAVAAELLALELPERSGGAPVFCP